MVEKRITTIEELVNILNTMIEEKNGISGFADDTFEIQKTNKAFLIKNKENTTTIEIPHSNFFSIEENVKRLESELSRVGIYNIGFEDDSKIVVNFNQPKDTVFCSYCNQPLEKCNCRNVNHPIHYTQGKIECIEAMEAMLTPEEFRGYLRGSIFKYQWRVMKKNGVEDLEKAKWYLDYLIKKMKEVDNRK